MPDTPAKQAGRNSCRSKAIIPTIFKAGIKA
jgi:hypothetical protein